MNNSKFTIGLFIFHFCSVFLQANDIQVIASFLPDRVKMGEEVRYVVTVVGASANINLPREVLQIEGLSYLSSSSRRNMSNRSGRMIVESASEYLFIAEKEGRYRMPSYEVTLDGKSFQVNEATLLVQGKSDDFQEDSPNDIFLTYDIPEKIYAGQVFPVELKLYVKRGLEFQLQNLPELEGSGFANPVMPNRVEEDRARVNDTFYEVIKLKFLTTALQSGKQEFSFTWPLGRPAQRSSRRSQGLFDSFFDRRELRLVEIKSRQSEIEVLPLPSEGRPVDFNGAIGMFSIAQDSMPAQAQVGQAVSMKIKVSGEGNFSSMLAPELALGDGWKIYDPTNEFIDEDGSTEDFGFSGTKVFEYLLIPETSEVSKTPAVQFSFFSPEDVQYISTTLPALPITVIPAASISPSEQNSSLPTVTSSTSVEETTGNLNQGSPLQIILYEDERVLPTTFLIYTPIYWGINGVIFLAFLSTGTALFIVRRRKNDPLYKEKLALKKKVKFYEEQARRAMESKEWERMINFGRMAICQSLVLGKDRDPLSLTFSEAEQFLKKSTIYSEQDKETIRSVLEMAEKSRFASQSIDLQSHRAEIESLWKIL